MSEPAARQTTEPWTTRRLLAWMTESFTKRGIDSPKLCAEILLSTALGCERLALYMQADREATPEQLNTLRALAQRALAHEPVQYLTGEAWFYGVRLTVDSRVLIPRPETETIVDLALEHLKARASDPDSAPLVADICTGSGAIACAIARHAKAATLLATDLSAEALEVARANAAACGIADRVEFARGDMLAPLDGRGDFEVICSNPPYIPDDEWADVEPNVKDHEPEMALRGGADGLDLVRPLLAGAIDLLKPGGLLLIEIASSRAGEAEALAKARGYEGVTILRDLAARPRVVRAVRPS